MATVDSLEQALRQRTSPTASSKQSLSDYQYSAGLAIFEGCSAYEDFIVPQLCRLIAPLFNSHMKISVLEIGPGPKSILGKLPHHIRQKIVKYAAFEPNHIFATCLEKWLCAAPATEPPLLSLEGPPNIQCTPFDINSDTENFASVGTSNDNEKYNLVLFCHSMYGMRPKAKFIERALNMLVERPEDGLVIVFHRGRALQFDKLVCYKTDSFYDGVVRVPDKDDVLDSFAAFVAGFIMQDMEADKAIRAEWREVCRALGHREDADPDHLLFNSPEIMMAFTRHATALPELIAQVPLVREKRIVKNREAHLYGCAATVRPTKIQHVQQCIQWALKHGVGLTVIGGGHSGHCLWPSVVSVDMAAFDQVHLLTGEEKGEAESDSNPLVVAEAGCKVIDIIHKSMEAGVTVPLGSRPSVGAGLWLQGGLGHLARLYGLACDHIVGAGLVSVNSGEVFCIGRVPSQHWPDGAVRPKNEIDLLWAIKGAGTNFGIIISVTFRTHVAPTYTIRNWVIPLSDDFESQRKIQDFDNFVAGKLSRNCSADAYLYWESGQLHLGVTMFESSTTVKLSDKPLLSTSSSIDTILGPGDDCRSVDGMSLFDAEMYMSRMHGGHGGNKTSAFKRCLFLKGIGAVDITDRLLAAIRNRPTPLCYLHLLQGGGAITDVGAEATAFSCRDWDFACVISGVWPRNRDGTEVSEAVKRWVYDVARDLLPFSSGAYGADLGPDPRDAALAAKAFGPNRPRLAQLKQSSDPHNVLAYACPLPRAPGEQTLIVLVTGESCAGKDYCANVWVAALNEKGLRARVVSINDATKQEYAAASGADFERLLYDRSYKEQHCPALTAFFHSQVRRKPRLPEEHFLNVVRGALVTKYGEFAEGVIAMNAPPMAARLTEKTNEPSTISSLSTALDYRPTLFFDNDTAGDETVKRFAEDYLLPFFHEDLRRLSNMVRLVPGFPRAGIDFRHVLNIAQQPGGLALCTSLLRYHFTGDWAKVDMIACCEAGSLVFAPLLASQVNVPLALIREAGKLPPPTISVSRSASHISSLTLNAPTTKRIEIGRDVIPPGASVVVVDDTLATGETLVAVLQLLGKAGIPATNISILVIAEFPVHRGRDFLRQNGFGGVNIQSLLVYGTA
ncbi:hypothetical protein ACMYSQ_012326 [Aspergillus niger]